MKIINTYIVAYNGLMLMFETDGQVNANGYGKYYTFTLLQGILPLKEEAALVLIKK